ncbi:MAG: N-acyl-D-glucosamine 2-epimerase [Pedobacter sp.]|nr:MAG: N-acyl-D-glucosamine 2-epimerase [Pedobacter sp.]
MDPLKSFAVALDIELNEILHWWKNYTVDHALGGFYGEVGCSNIAIANQPKGLVLNSRILWTFSSAFLLKVNIDDLEMAKRAFVYLSSNFYDQKNGGFYWSVSAGGEALDKRKQIYGQAFAIYGLAEFYKATQDEYALRLAKETFLLIEKHSFDPIHLGYTEAFGQEWGTIEDLRLSEKDLNTEKSMNTHLHIIEAYANLYRLWKDERLEKAIRDLLFVFEKYVINNHLTLFFSKDWTPQSSVVSYGHDIEAAWLLQECAESLGDRKLVDTFKRFAISLTDAIAVGIDEDGGMFYEYDASRDHWVREKHWWPQAEAMVGFFNAYQITSDKSYLNQALQSWTFIKTSIKDQEKGEWFWGIYPDGSLMQESKAGFWKCPYHNVRACMEIVKRAHFDNL